MYETCLSSLFLIWALFLAPTACDSCPYKECECSGTYIECEQRGLTSMPMYNFVEDPQFLTLTLDMNNITYIPDGSLPTGLNEISLTENPITTIDDNAFEVVSTTLESLYFTQSRFERIPDAFLHLDALKHLNIMQSRILDWNVGAMAHIGQTLETLNVEFMGITKWPDWIQFCSRLNELSLSGNSISSIPDGALDNVANTLMTLSLENNNFTSVPKSLSKLKALITLDLQSNRISNLTWLPASSKLFDLMINNNSISDTDHLSDSLRPFKGSLSSLTLATNKLKAIPNFSFLTNVQGLDFSHNQISDPYSGLVPASIYSLDLSFNLLPSVPSIYMNLKLVTNLQLPNNAIRHLQGSNIPAWVTDIDVGYNLIAELTDTSFPINSSLEGLILNYNPIVTISELAFKNTPVLYSLNIQGTKLTRLPLTLGYLTHLNFLDMRNNPYLVCTCLEKNLQQILTSEVEISGDCGKVTIFYFFSTLSQMCP